MQGIVHGGGGGAKVNYNGFTNSVPHIQYGTNKSSYTSTVDASVSDGTDWYYTRSLTTDTIWKFSYDSGTDTVLITLASSDYNYLYADPQSQLILRRGSTFYSINKTTGVSTTLCKVSVTDASNRCAIARYDSQNLLVTHTYNGAFSKINETTGVASKVGSVATYEYAVCLGMDNSYIYMVDAGGTYVNRIKLSDGTVETNYMAYPSGGKFFVTDTDVGFPPPDYNVNGFVKNKATGVVTQIPAANGYTGAWSDGVNAYLHIGNWDERYVGNGLTDTTRQSPRMPITNTMYDKTWHVTGACEISGCESKRYVIGTERVRLSAPNGSRICPSGGTETAMAGDYVSAEPFTGTIKYKGGNVN